MNFVFARPQNREYTILNRTPLRGEPAEWTSNLNDTQRVYGVVAFMPNLNGNGHVLILEGTSSPGTECAWDFVSNDLTLLPFLNSIKREDRSVPHFQVVVECTNLTGSSVERHLVAWRTMK
jgi:surface antigen